MGIGSRAVIQDTNSVAKTQRQPRFIEATRTCGDRKNPWNLRLFDQPPAAPMRQIVMAPRMHRLGTMHASDLVELAALVSAEAPAAFRRGGRFSSAGADAYWVASKCRLDRWARQLKSGSDERTSLAACEHPACLSTCLEVLISEILTRVWAAAAIAADRRGETSELAPVAQSILFGHHEARVTVLNFIAADLKGRPGSRQRQAQRLDRVRRVSERWTDLLLAPLSAFCDLEAIAHDPARVRDFAEDRIDDRESPTGDRARAILNASLHSAFQRFSAWPSRNADLNSQIAAAILTCLNLDSLDPASTTFEGPLSSWLLQARLLNATNETERLVNGLLEADQPNSVTRD
jgi:hypothetical protein